MNSPPERRKHKRYKLKNGILAEIGPFASKVGPITDISLGGLAFRYIDSPRLRRRESHELNIWAGKDTYLFKIPYQNASDRRLSQGGSRDGADVRQRRVQFTGLPPNKLDLLKKIIADYADET